MEKDIKGIMIPLKIWYKNYKTYEEKEQAIFAYVEQYYGKEVADAGGFKNGK